MNIVQANALSIDSIFAFDRARAAFDHMRRAAHRGKIVIDLQGKSKPA